MVYDNSDLFDVLCMVVPRRTTLLVAQTSQNVPVYLKRNGVVDTVHCRRFAWNTVVLYSMPGSSKQQSVVDSPLWDTGACDAVL